MSAISERTGFVQSHVSASVARLQSRRLVASDTDPTDRRRTLITPTPGAVSAIIARASRDIRPALQDAVGEQEASRVAELLAELARLLLRQR